MTRTKDGGGSSEGEIPLCQDLPDGRFR